MYRIGIDCVEIARMADKAARDAFVSRVFGSDELSEISARGSKPVNFAVCFAAKEAFSKAVGTGLSGFRLNEVQLLHESSGRPFFKLSGAAEKYAENEFDVSVTHTSELVIVTVVMNEV